MVPTPPSARALRACGSLFTLLLAPGLLAAQATPPTGTRAERPRPVATAVERTSPVKLDGRLDDAAWAAATPVSEFTQQRPTEGAPATERTEVRFLFDDDAIWLGARMYDSQGRAGVTSRLARRDASVDSDILRIDFDPYRDRLRSVEFDVNPAGWRGDATDRDRSWDPVWEVATTIDSLGWTAEIRIPFSQLRFSRDSVQTWGLNLTRITHRTQERALWAFWGTKEPGGPAFFGDLAGLRMRGRPQRAELLPYVVTRDQRLGAADPQSPFYSRSPRDVRLGADMKYRLTSSFTLSATANPDFGQVEVDPAVVNLSAYESFFPERRPFFVEGRDVFDFGSPGCNINCGFGIFPFYSRRIGRAPQGAGLALGAGPFADVPQNTTILGAAKLTGRTASGYSVGVVNAVTREEFADVALEDGRRLRRPVEPLTNSFVGRVRRELRGGNLVVGGMLTSVNRRLGDSSLATLLSRSAQTAGVDVEASWAKRTYNFYGALSASRVAGDSLAILRVQRSSARYFQRPDRDPRGGGLFEDAYDPSATALGGGAAIARLDKRGGSWIWDLNASSFSPGFETNDLGFLQRTGYRWLNGSLGRRYTAPTRWYRELTWGTGTARYANFDGDVTGREAIAVVEATFPSYWTAFAGVQHDFATLDDRATRGGPVIGRAAGTGVFSNLSTDRRKRVVLRVGANGGRGDDGSRHASINLSATLKPASNVSLSVGPGFSSSTTTAQYVTSVADSTATLFAGRRYVFAHLAQRELYMGTRASVTFTPALSLELFAQPLIASGDYYDFKEFAAPRQLDRRVYGRDVGTVVTTRNDRGARRYVIDPDGGGPASAFGLGDPNFNFRSLRGTGVLRWEWQPGSTAFLVWTQTRSGSAPVGNLVFSRDRRELLDAPADNIFLLKISYLLGF